MVAIQILRHLLLNLNSRDNGARSLVDSVGDLIELMNLINKTFGNDEILNVLHLGGIFSVIA